MNLRDFFFIVLAVFIGGLLAMLVWTLIVKDQVNATIAATGSSPIGRLLGLGGTP
jgi:hypothetical protein